jgi:hypothetical protein
MKIASLDGSDEVNSPTQKKNRLRKGGVGPEMRSPAGLTVGILREVPCLSRPVKVVLA